ncbi:alpha/beta hydrolase [Hydrogenophaga sp. SL48]|uniref:alpha/beta hydrolase n=1 Tax=Hydrogenophaga sp. SL48 TaxID=2806347 RepID=UPI001F414BC4|nr:alpha/beta hydrolase [Hydrogenophaga sp. SL48]UJW80024.1 alpha/beta hydrolase [Hydrogenophaga sp. SL48]
MTPTPDTPRRHWLAALGLLPLLQACSPLRVINALVPTGTHRFTADQAYGPDARQRLDVYQPDPPVADAPIVVFFYGGSWSSGRRQDYRFVGEALASRGIVTLVADYRLSPQVRYPVFVQDSALALRWAVDRAANLGASPQRVFAVGHSAGAYNAAMLALDPRWLGAVALAPERLAGWVGLAGPYDFLPIGVPEVRVAFEWPQTPADSQPLFHARRSGPGRVPRTLLLAARNDTLVDPRRNTQALASALGQRGIAVELELLEGVSHTTLIGAMAAPLRGLAPVLDRVSAFITRPPA